MAAGAVVAALSGGSSPAASAAPAPAVCLDRWNADADARTYTRHNRTFHRYTEAEVGYMPSDASTTAVDPEPDRGACVVVFARSSLDPEAVAAGQILLDGEWTPLSELVAPDELAAMQSAALADANAVPTESGALQAR